MENDMALRQKVQDFKLPEVVQADINSWICVANTLAITTALFAAVQISLNAIVEQLMFSGKSMPLRVLRWIMYASVLVNISGTASAISVVNMASSLSSEARSQFFKGRDMNSTLPRVLLRPESSFARLRHFGMPSVFLWLTRLMLISYFAGSICLFISFYVWVFITQSKAAAASLLPIGIPAFFLNPAPKWRMVKKGRMANGKVKTWTRPYERANARPLVSHKLLDILSGGSPIAIWKSRPIVPSSFSSKPPKSKTVAADCLLMMEGPDSRNQNHSQQDSNPNANDASLAFTTSSSNMNNRDHFVQGDVYHSSRMSDERLSMTLGTLSSGTSFGSFDNVAIDQGLRLQNAAGRMDEADHQAATVNAPNATFVSGSLPAPIEHSEAPNPYSASSGGEHNRTNRLVSLPPDILRRIFAIATAGSNSSRLHLPLVCHALYDLVHHGCPEMWDTLEILTGNGGALSRRPQVDYVIARSGERSLTIGVGVASCRLGAWKESSDEDLDEEQLSVWSAQPVQKRGVKMVQLVLDLMPRVVDLTLDVHDAFLDPELERAVLAMFSDKNTTNLRRLTLLGTFQLNRIVRSMSTPSPMITPELVHLRHITIAYAPQFRMTVEIPQVTSLTIFMVQIESPSNASTLESVVSGFPNLHELEILGVVYRMGSAFAASQSRTGNPIKETRTVLLPRLRRLVLHYLALTNSLFSSLLIPNVETLVLRDFEPGFDPRDIRFNTTLASHRDPQSSPIDSPGPTTTTTQETAGLQALPFGRFLANNDSLPQLRHLVLERIPDMVVRMCVDFVHIVDREATTTATTTAGRTTITGRTDGKSGSGGGLSHLLLADFRWPDWASLFPAEMPSEGSGSIPLPHLQHLEIQIDHNVGLRIVGGNSVRNETSVERQEWMNGLLKLAEWRMSPSAVVKMLREWNHEIPSWVVCQSSDDDSKTGNEHDHDRDQLLGRFGSSRTLQDVSLATGYVDSYPFLHAAWVALQREHTPGQDESSKSE